MTGMKGATLFGICRARLGSLLLCLLITGACKSESQAELAVVHVAVVDIASGELLPDRTVLIEEGRITAVAPSSRLSVPPDAEVVDGTAKFLMPGLADMHVHFGRGGGLPNRSWSFDVDGKPAMSSLPTSTPPAGC